MRTNTSVKWRVPYHYMSFTLNRPLHGFFQIWIKRRIIIDTAGKTSGKSALKLGNRDTLKASEDILLHKVTKFYRLLFGESRGAWVGWYELGPPPYKRL